MLPSFDRSVLSLVELAPDVDFQEGDTAGGQMLDISGVGASVSGNRGGRNGFYLDGVDNTGAFRNQGLNFPNPDTVQESPDRHHQHGRRIRPAATASP